MQDCKPCDTTRQEKTHRYKMPKVDIAYNTGSPIVLAMGGTLLRRTGIDGQEPGSAAAGRTIALRQFTFTCSVMR